MAFTISGFFVEDIGAWIDLADWSVWIWFEFSLMFALPIEVPIQPLLKITSFLKWIQC